MTEIRPPKNGLIFVLDRSGSMKSILDNTIKNHNDYLAEMKAIDSLEWTLVQFDTIGTDTIHARIPVKEVPDLNRDTFVPRGGTPLIDAACITIDRAIDKYAQTDKIILVILTDGEENSSTDYTMHDLHSRIKTVSGWGWQVVFLGASVDAYKDARRAGVSGQSTMSYDSHNIAMAASAFRSLSTKSTQFYASGQSMSFSDEDKAAAGDLFHVKQKTGQAQAAPVAPLKPKSLVDEPKL